MIAGPYLSAWHYEREAERWALHARCQMANGNFRAGINLARKASKWRKLRDQAHAEIQELSNIEAEQIETLTALNQ